MLGTGDLAGFHRFFHGDTMVSMVISGVYGIIIDYSVLI